MEKIFERTRKRKAVNIALAVILALGLIPTASFASAHANDGAQTETGSIEGTVWLDLDGNGAYDGDDTLLAGAAIYLMDAPRVAASPETYEQEAIADETAALAVAQTDAGGGYIFEGIPAGDYFVKVDRSGHAWPTSYTAVNKLGADGYTRVIAVAPGASVTGIDAGLVASEEEGIVADDDDPLIEALAEDGEAAEGAPVELQTETYANSISGFMWADKVNNGVFEPEAEGEDAEWPIEGWTVYLLRAADQSVAAETTTAADGRYEFTGIEPGDYVVKPFYNKPDTQEYRQTRIGLVGANKILSATESSDWAGTTGIITIAEDSKVSDLDIGMKVKPGYSLQAITTYTSTLNESWMGFFDAAANPIAGVKVYVAELERNQNTLVYFNVLEEVGVSDENGIAHIPEKVYQWRANTSVNGFTTLSRIQLIWDVTDLGISYGGSTRYNVSGPSAYTLSSSYHNEVYDAGKTPATMDFAAANYYFNPSGSAQAPIIVHQGRYAIQNLWNITGSSAGDNGKFSLGNSSQPFYYKIQTNVATLTQKYEDVDGGGVQLQANKATSYALGTVVTPSAPPSTLGGKTYIGYYLDNDPTLHTGTSTLTMDIDHIIRHQYGTVYTVSFDADGGSPLPSSQTILSGQKATKPATDPDKGDGSKFIGWYNGSTKWDFATDAVTSNINLVAKYAAPATVIFDANYAGALPYQSANAYVGETVTKPSPDPARPGYAFDGKWYKDAACTQEWNFATDTVPVGGTRLYAGWTQLYTATYNLVDRNNTPVAGLTAPSAEANKAAGSTFGPVTAPSGATVNKAYVGWKDGLGGTLQTTAITGTMGAANKDIYLVYGTDNGKTGDDADGTNTPDGKEDVAVTRHFKATDGTALTGNLTPTKVVVNLEDSPYATAQTGVTQAGWAYAGWNTTGSTSSYTAGAPNVALSADTNVDVYYMYTKSTYAVNVYKVDRSGTSLGAPQTEAALTHGFNFTKTTTPAINISNPVANTTLIGWKVGSGGTVTWDKSPNVAITGATDIYLIYGQDKGNNDDGNPQPDGTEDVTITKQFQVKDVGTTLKSDVSVYRNVPSQFTETGDTISGYTYWGYELDGGGQVAGNPNVALAGGTDHTVTYLYTAANQNITLQYEKLDGTQLVADGSATAPTGSSWSLSAAEKSKTVSGETWVLVDWKYAGDAGWKGNKNPVLSPVPAGGKTVILRYQHDWDGDGTEDVKVTKHYKHNGTDIKTSDSEIINLVTGTEKFTTAAPGIAGYTYKDFQVGTNAAQTGTPNISVAGLNDFDVTYNYNLNSYTINVHYVDRLGASVASTETMTLDHFFTITKTSTPKALTVKPVSEKCLVAWKVGAAGAVNEDTNPSVQITGATDIYLIYGQDKVDGNDDPGQDGVEDFDVVEIHKQGATELSRGTITKNKGKNYAGGPLPTYLSSGYTYASYQIDGAAAVSQPATPSISNLNAAHTVVINYTKNAYQVKVHHVNRDGSEMGSYLQTVSLDHGYVFNNSSSPTALAKPAIPQKVLVGWKVGLGGTETWNQNPSATITGATDIYLIYGQDKVDGNDDPGQDGVEDFDITETHKAGATVLSTNVVTKNKGKAYAGQPSAVHTAAGYNYASYELDGGAAVSQPAKPTVANVQGTHAVVFNYALAQYQVQVTYEDRAGNALAGSQAVQIAHGSNFSTGSTPALAIPSFTEKCLVDWKLDGVSQGNTTPALSNVTGAHAIVLVYGQDKVVPGGGTGQDGVEDFDITIRHWTQLGGQIIADTVVARNVGEVYAASPDPQVVGPMGYVYEGYEWDSDALVAAPATPSKTVTGEHTLTFRFTPNDYVVSVTYEDRAGTALAGSQSETIVHGAAFNTGSTPALATPSFTEKCLVDWKLDGVSQGNTAPGIASVTGAHAIVLVYGQDKVDGDGDPGQDGVEDFDIVETHMHGATQLSTKTVTLNKGTQYDGAFDSVQISAGYTYTNYVIAGGATGTAPALPQIAAVSADESVALYYLKNDYNVVVTYEDRDGTVLAGSQTEAIAHGAAFDGSSTPALVVPSFTEKCLVDWKLDGVSQGNTTPALSNVTGGHSIVLVYGQDKVDGDGDPGQDGVEDFNIVETHMNGASLISTNTVTLNKGVPYNGAPLTTAGLTYASYSIVSGASGTAPAVPQIASLAGNHAVTFNYTTTTYTVTVESAMRDGGAAGASTYTAQVSHGGNFDQTTTPKLVVPTLTKKVLVDWLLDGVSQGNANPALVNVTAGCTVTLVFGNDNGGGGTDDNPVPDGKEDVAITKKWETAGGTTLAPTKTVYRNVEDSPFVEAGGTIAGYTYSGYKIDGGSLVTTPVSVALVGGTDFAITYVYAAANQTITLKFEDRSGATVKADVTTAALTDSVFTPSSTQLDVTDYALVDWKLSTDAGWRGDTSPSAGVPAGGFTMVLQYGQDKGDGDDDNPQPDGTEDVTITKKWETTGGTTLAPSKTVYRNIPGPFAEAGGTIGGYGYVGYKIDGGAQQSGNPSIALVGGTDFEITYLYTAGGQSITLKFEDRNGASVKSDVSTSAATASVFAPSSSDLTVNDYILVDWKLSTDAGWRGNTNPSETVPAGGFTMVLQYGQDKGDGDDDDPQPDGTEDVTVVKKWETAGGTTLKAQKTVYRNLPGTFSDGIDAIGGFTYKGYKLDGGAFVASASAPSFALAAGTSYDVTYVYADETAPDAPTIDPVKPGTNTVTGEGDEAGNTITVTFPDGTTATGVVQPDGTWSVTVPGSTTPLAAGETVKATETDPANNVSPEGTRVVSPEPPAIDPIHPGAAVIMGDGNPGDTIDLEFPDGSTATGTVEPDGTWTIPVPGTTTPLEPGDVVEATATNTGGTSDPAERTVSPEPPAIDPIYPDSTVVTGGGEPGDTIVVTFPDGTTTETTTVEPDGTWEVPVPPTVVLEPGDVVTAIAVDGGGNESEEAERAVSPYPPVIDPIAPGATDVTGEGTPDSEIEVTFPDGSTGTGTVQPDGTWTVPVPPGVDLEEGDDVTATETDPNTGETSKPTDETVHDATAPTGLTLDDVYVTDTTVSGTSLEPGNTVTVTFPGGATATAIVQSDGTWTATVPGSVTLAVGDVVTAVEADGAGNVSAPVNTTVKDVLHAVTVTYEYKDGTALAGSQTVQVSHGTNLMHAQVTIPSFTEKVFTNWKLDGTPQNTTTIALSNVTGAHAIVLLYGQDKVDGNGDPNPDGIEDFTITETHHCADGHGGLATNEVYVNKGATYTCTPTAHVDHEYKGHTINGGAMVTGNPVIPNVQADHQVTLHQGHLDAEDHGNYDFVKTPNVTNAAAGSTVTYTFTGFSNKWGETINGYTITDMPDAGLDFVSANVPAFANAAGVTYDVVFYTNLDLVGKKLYTGIPATSAYTVQAPNLGSNEYITGISLEFGDVPAGFGEGNSITMQFRVWDTPPANVLGNTAYLSYSVDGEDKDYETSGPGTAINVDDGSASASGSVIKGKGAPTGLAKMGDVEVLAMLAFLVSVSGGILALAWATKRRREDDTA